MRKRGIAVDPTQDEYGGGRVCEAYANQATARMGAAIIGGSLGLALLGFGSFKRGNQDVTSPSQTISSSSDLEAKIRELDGMKSRGVIDETEYQRLRKNLIERS